MFTKVRSQMTLLFGGGSLLSIVMIVLTLMTLSDQRSDGVIINKAGRQRMLAQKMAKEAQAVLQGDAKAKDQLRVTSSEFETALGGLVSEAKKPAN